MQDPKLFLIALLLIATGTVAFVSCSLNHTVVVESHAPSNATSITERPALGQVDHSAWDPLLKKYVDDSGMVDYQTWKKTPEDLAALQDYLAALSRADARAQTSKAGKLAYWINAYNALTVHGILEVYPTASIRNHTAVAVGYNIWEDLLLPVGEQKYSLEDIEHKILRKLDEPRIHFAIVCASIGCPRLRNEAYTPAVLDEQLDDNTRDFFSRKQNLQFDSQRRIIRVSAILDWFSEDFGATPHEGLSQLAKYMPATVAQAIEQGEFTIQYLEYDWNLNEQQGWEGSTP